MACTMSGKVHKRSPSSTFRLSSFILNFLSSLSSPLSKASYRPSTMQLLKQMQFAAIVLASLVNSAPYILPPDTVAAPIAAKADPIAAKDYSIANKPPVADIKLAKSLTRVTTAAARQANKANTRNIGNAVQAAKAVPIAAKADRLATKHATPYDAQASRADSAPMHLFGAPGPQTYQP